MSNCMRPDCRSTLCCTLSISYPHSFLSVLSFSLCKNRLEHHVDKLGVGGCECLVLRLVELVYSLLGSGEAASYCGASDSKDNGQDPGNSQYGCRGEIGGMVILLGTDRSSGVGNRKHWDDCVRCDCFGDDCRQRWPCMLYVIAIMLDDDAKTEGNGGYYIITFQMLQFHDSTLGCPISNVSYDCRWHDDHRRVP